MNSDFAVENPPIKLTIGHHELLRAAVSPLSISPRSNSSWSSSWKVLLAFCNMGFDSEKYFSFSVPDDKMSMKEY